MFGEERGFVEATLEAEHQGLRVVALKQLCEFAVALQGSGEGFLKKDALAGLDHHECVLAMEGRVGGDDGDVGHVGTGEGGDVVDDGSGGAGHGEEAPSGWLVDGGDGGEAAEVGLLGEFVNVEGVDHTHAAEAGDGYADGVLWRGRDRRHGGAPSSTRNWCDQGNTGRRRGLDAVPDFGRNLLDGGEISSEFPIAKLETVA